MVPGATRCAKYRRTTSTGRPWAASLGPPGQDRLNADPAAITQPDFVSATVRMGTAAACWRAARRRHLVHPGAMGDHSLPVSVHVRPEIQEEGVEPRLNRRRCNQLRYDSTCGWAAS